MAVTTPLKLNLGSGQNPQTGYVNVDKYGSADIIWDLEKFPWPWDDNSVDEIILTHVLEHLGESIATFFAIIKELYRISQPGAVIHIVVPHPRHDDFLGDPTHVRSFMPESFLHYSKAMCLQWQKSGMANSPLALYLDVDFNMTDVQLVLADPWRTRFDSKSVTNEALFHAMKQFNNVVKEIRIRWVVVKETA